MRVVGRWRSLLVAALSFVATVSVAWPCSRVSSGGFGPVWTGESWGYFGAAPPSFQAPNAAFSSGGSVVLYDGSGSLLLAEAFAAPRLQDGVFYAQALSADGSVWGTVHCSDWDEPLEPLCEHFVRVDATGEILETAAKGSSEPWRTVTSLDVRPVGGLSTKPPSPLRL